MQRLRRTAEKRRAATFAFNELRQGGKLLQLVKLPNSSEYANARCLDGSPYGYYIDRSITNSSKWIFFLQGGGLCVEPVDCISRSKTSLGSSLHWSDVWNVGSDGGGDILSSNPSVNPYFSDFNHVYMKYCSGDTWTGTRTSKNFWGLHFAGHLNIQAVFKHLNTSDALGGASSVLLMGASAGGIGVFQNADFVKTKLVPHVAHFKAVPVSGFYFPGPVEEYYEDVLHLHLPINAIASWYLTHWFASALDESCVVSTPTSNQHRCWDASFLYKHVETPLFVIENLFDQNQINDILLCPTEKNSTATRAFVKKFGETMTFGLRSNVQSKVGYEKGDGLFAPSCFSHTSNICVQRGPIVKSKSLREVLPAWFETVDTRNSTTFQLRDDCVDSDGSPCNRHCSC